jgi:hypothetical protein
MYDILVVGSGIVGIHIAEALVNQGLSIGLIEAGEMDGCIHDMNYIETGTPEKIKVSNAYSFGGGHNVWHGLLARMSDAEIQKDKNIWGIGLNEFNEYYDLAEEYFGLSISDKISINGIINNQLKKNNLNHLDTKIFYQPPLNFDKKKRYKKLIDNKVKIHLGKKVEKVKKTNSVGFELITKDGAKFYSKAVILAANPIQNAVILNNSDSNSNLKPNQRVYSIADHPMGVIGKIEFKKNIRLPLFFIRQRFKKNFAKVGIMITDPHSELRHTFYLVPTMESRFNESSGSLRQQLIAMRDSGITIKLIFKILYNFSTILFILGYKFGWLFKTKYADILVVSEQEISKDNYIEVLNGKILKNWNISNILAESILRSSKILSKELSHSFELNDINILKLDEIKKTLTSAAHLCCSMRIFSSSNKSLLDDNYCVIGIPGLYVAGSSGFPRALSLNNTLTAVAISHKLVKGVVSYLKSMNINRGI